MPFLFLSLLLLPSRSVSSLTTDIFWNSSSPLFLRRGPGPPYSPTIRVGEGGGREWDQLHLHCPTDGEQLVIYRVSRAEYLTCQVAAPRPEVVMVCQGGGVAALRTITLRPYSPTPGGLEFPPGSSNYFISTSSPTSLHNRQGGLCSSHNLRLAILCAPSPATPHPALLPAPAPFPTLPPRFRSLSERLSPPPSLYTGRRPTAPSSAYLYYYSPRDLLRINSKARRLDSLGKEARSQGSRRLDSLGQEARSKEARSQDGKGMDSSSEEFSSQARVSAGGHLATPSLLGLLLQAPHPPGTDKARDPTLGSQLQKETLGMC
jgi:hypothetical protein